MSGSDDEKLADTEIDARREAGLKKLLATSPKPHKPKDKIDGDSPARDRQAARRTSVPKPK